MYVITPVIRHKEDLTILRSLDLSTNDLGLADQ